MARIVVFGNSGSGKSTLAQRVAQDSGSLHLDLDTVAWNPNQPGIRLPIEESDVLLRAALLAHQSWIVEGCYSSLIALAASEADAFIFLNPGVAACQKNCRNRPWEPHKYSSPVAQDKNLSMLLNWVADYVTRDDEFSLKAHRNLFDRFDGPKHELCTAQEISNFGI